MRNVTDYIPVSDKDVVRDRAFVKAVQLLTSVESYNHKEIITKLTKNKSVLQKKLNHKEYIYHIEELFNKNNSKRYYIYQTDQPKKAK